MKRLLAPLSALLCLLPLAPAQNQGVALSATVDGYIEIPYSPLVVPRSGITVEAWITYDDATLPTGWRYPTIVRQGLASAAAKITSCASTPTTSARACCAGRSSRPTMPSST